MREFSWERDFGPFTRHEIICDVARGMEYLHGNKVFHRNLSSRNILLTGERKAVIADFGMSKTLSAIESLSCGGGKGESCSIAWAESLLDAKNGDKRAAFSPCDVFSFGIVIWEVISSSHFGGQSLKILISSMSQGKNLPRIQFSTNSVLYGKEHIAMMRSCLLEDGRAHERPTFQEIVSAQREWGIHQSEE